jgi:hypothetical protein
MVGGDRLERGGSTGPRLLQRGLGNGVLGKQGRRRAREEILHSAI